MEPEEKVKKYGRNKEKFEEEKYNNLEIKFKEKDYLIGTFNYLCDLQNEPSSDDNSKEKIYYKKIEEKVKEKKMKINYEIPKINKPKPKKSPVKKKYKEDLTEEPKIEIQIECVDPSLYRDPPTERELLKKKKFGVKAIRKALHKLTKKVTKNEIKTMVWEIDTDLDGFVSFDEYERMYKRCVLDENEKEPKKLYYLIQFLMFDKEKKGEVTVEDTLEILCVRSEDIDESLYQIFGIEERDEKGNLKNTKKQKETITYDEFIQRMNTLSLRKRNQIMNKKKNFCEKLKLDALNGLKGNE